MKFEAKTKERESLTYGIWNNDMHAWQFVNSWGGTECMDLECAQNKAEQLNYLSLVDTWKRAYKLTLIKIPAMKRRLKELQTWDLPKTGNEIEHKAKK